MKEKEATSFYRGLFKLVPSLAEKKEGEIINVAGSVFHLLFNLVATRDHIRVALAEHKGNVVKRAWDLKHDYIVSILLKNPQATNASINQVIKSLFNQRTRTSVIESCRRTALVIQEECPLEEINSMIAETQRRYQAKAKEPSVLE